MVKQLQILVVTIAVLMTAGEKALAAVIGSFSMDQQHYGLFQGMEGDPTFEASFHLRSDVNDPWRGHDAPPNTWQGWVSMIDITLNNSLVGNTWTYGSASPGFAKNVEVLTNGIDDVYAIMAPGEIDPVWDWAAWPENYIWGDYPGKNSYSGENGIDFEGYKIDAITFTLDEFSPDGDPDLLSYTIAIHGEHVPIPGTMLLLSWGIVGLAALRRFKHGHNE